MCEDDARQLQRPRASSEQDSARNTALVFCEESLRIFLRLDQADPPHFEV